MKKVEKDISIKVGSQVEESNEVLVGIDVGFGAIKILSSAKPQPFAIPSTVVEGHKSSSKLFSLNGIDKDQLIVTTEEGTYFIGEHAMYMPTAGSKRTQARNRAKDRLSRVLFRTGIALSCPDEEGEYHVHLVTGLPNDDYGLSINDDLQEFLNQSFDVTFHLGEGRSVTKTIHIVTVDVLRQPEGTVTQDQFEFDLKDQHTFVKAREGACDYLGIIDFGHFTTDFALFQEGIIIESDTVNGSTVGVTEVYNRLRSKLTKKFDILGLEYRATDKDLDKAVTTFRVRFAGQDFDVQDEVEETASEVSRMIAKAVFDAWGNDTNRLEKILITGGGAHVFQSSLIEEFDFRKKQQFEKTNHSQFSNVTGFYMYGAMSLSSKVHRSELYDNYIIPVFEKELA